MPKGPQGQKRNLTLSAAMGGGLLLFIALERIINSVVPSVSARIVLTAGLVLAIITGSAMIYLAMSSGNRDA